jgi:TetR/AcrR family transcriptional repressor of multidrug resistance operon
LVVVELPAGEPSIDPIAAPKGLIKNERSFINLPTTVRVRDPEKQQAIREKALEMIVERGFDGLSMHKLARAAGVSPATIYIYFKSRDDLILSLWREESRQMADSTLAGFDPEMSFAEGLRVQWINRARYFMAHPKRMHFMEQIRFSPFHGRENPRHSHFADTMCAFVEGCIARGELIRMPIEVYWAIAFAPLYQLVKFHMHGGGMPGSGPFALDDKILDQTLGLVLKALTP